MTIGITQRRVWPAPARAGARRGANPDLRKVHTRRRAPTRGGAQ